MLMVSFTLNLSFVQDKCCVVSLSETQGNANHSQNEAHRSVTACGGWNKRSRELRKPEQNHSALSGRQDLCAKT